LPTTESTRNANYLLAFRENPLSNSNATAQKSNYFDIYWWECTNEIATDSPNVWRDSPVHHHGGVEDSIEIEGA
jgi:hypothetical protein